MDAIATQAGVTKPILYRHFGDKGGLYQALAERYVRALMDALRGALGDVQDPRDQVATTVDTYLSFIESEREVYAFLMHRAVQERPEAQETLQDFIRQVAREVAIVLREQLERAGIDTGGSEAWAHGIVGMVHLAGDWWIENGTMSRQQLCDRLVALLWSGFVGLPQLSRRDERTA